MKIEGNILVQVEDSDLIDGTFTIPPEVDTIGFRCFAYLPNLTAIDIPNTIKDIRAGAFEMTGLVSVIVPQSVTTAAGKIFIGSTKLEEVIVRNPNLKVNDWFIGCDSLVHIQLGLFHYSVYVYERRVWEKTEQIKCGDYTAYHLYRFRSERKDGRWLVVTDEGETAVGITRESARAMASKANYTEAELEELYGDITADTPLSPVMFHRITGACTIGIDEWLVETGRKITDTLPVVEVLKSIKEITPEPFKKLSAFVLRQYKRRANAAKK